jgi:aryl-phospho-beta-D-glucosidase BglC (GH1 family)/cellulase/cellobiase CelA1
VATKQEERDMAAINYVVGDDWGSGFIGNMIVPAGSQGLQGWTLEFDAGFDITNIWGAEIVSHVGNHYVIRNAAWNANVPANGQASFGFQAVPGEGGTTATGFTLNGSAETPPPPVVPTLSVDDASIIEGDSGQSQLTFTVRLSQAASGPVSVSYSTANGTATAGSDYAAVSGTLTFASGETIKTITVPVTGDTAVEANETFSVHLSAASGATISDSSATGSIANDDAAPPPPPAGGTSLDYHVVSNWGSGFTGSMSVGAGGSALHGWTVEFDATFTISSIWNAVIVSHVGNHYVVKNAEWNGEVGSARSATFGFQAVPGSGGTAATGFAVNGVAVGTPPPDLPTVSVADAVVAEGDSGMRELVFTVTLSAAATGPVTVAYATGNGTATAGSDYAALSGTLTFAAGETSKVVRVQVSGDSSVEANETMTLMLSSPNGATVADGSAVGTIANDDAAPLPTLSISDSSVAEGSAASPGVATFTVSLSAASAAAVTVSFATADGTATAGSDYVARSGSLTFAPGETAKTIQVTAIGDSVIEGNEGFSVLLTGPSGAAIADGTGAGTIANDDVAPPVLPTVSISDASVVEGDPGAGSGAAAGWFSTAGNQIVDAAGHSVQIAGVNWFGFESSNLSPHGVWTRGYKEMMDQMKDLGFNTIRLPFSNDTIHSTAMPSGIDFSKNPDLQGLTALQIMDKIVAYAGEIGLRIILDHHRNDSGPGPSPNGLWYDGQHSEAEWIADWQMLAGRYAGDPTVIGADLHNEPYNGTWGGGGPNDWAAAAERAGNAIGAVNPNWLIFVEGVASYQGTPYWWGGNLMGVRDRPIDLVVDNKLVYSAHDYPNSVWPQPWFQGGDFPANLPAKFDQMWGYIYKEGIAPVFIGEFGTRLEDPKDAPWLEAITSYLSGDLDNNGTSDIPAGSTGVSWTYWSWNPNSGDTGGILADDWRTVHQDKMAYLTPIQFDLDGDVAEGGGAQAIFTISLSAPATQIVTVAYQTVPGEADGADFVGQSGTVTFAPGEQSKTVAVAITPDAIDEPNERFSVVLSNPQNATVADGTAVGTIVDDDDVTAPTVPALSIDDATITEGDGGSAQLTFTVRLSQAATGPVTVNYATANGTATAGSDYAATSGTIAFAAGQTARTVTVAVTGDSAVEGNETFTVSLSGATGATIADGSATGTIVNNDVAAPDPSGDLEARFALVDSWNSGFNGNVVVHNEGSSTSNWQIVIEMPYQIADIWNARVISHVGNTYVIGPAAWNGSLAHDGETSFGFVASGQYNAASIQVHGVGEDDVPDAVPTVPTGLQATSVSSTSTLLSWNASSVPGGGFVTGYAVFVDGEHVATTAATSYRVTGLAPDSDYRFSVAAIDAAGSSDPTSPVSVHTALPLPNADDGHMFSPYIDMAMSVAADLTGLSEVSGIKNFTLAFVLSSDEGIGWQGWGTIEDDTLANGTTILEHVQNIQAAGGNITISFGGAAGEEAALNATSVAHLQAQYQSVIDRYAITSIDFDIEGGAIRDHQANDLRAEAIAGLQAANPDLKVSFTLPVLPTGLTQDGIDLLHNAMDNGVRVDLVNIMAMDYGTAVDNNGQMGLNAILASEATQQQLASIGLDARIGITPMIGVNDIVSEVFTLGDARALVDYAANDPDVAMLSMWSVARDNGGSAGANYASPDSSGIAQQPFEFASIFHQYDIL